MESILFGHWIEVFLYIRCIGYIQHFWSGHFELYIRSRSWADFAGCAASTWFSRCCYLFLVVADIFMKPGADHVLGELLTTRISSHFSFLSWCWCFLWSTGGKQFIQRKRASVSGECFCLVYFWLERQNQQECLSVCWCSLAYWPGSFSGINVVIRSKRKFGGLAVPHFWCCWQSTCIWFCRERILMFLRRIIHFFRGFNRRYGSWRMEISMIYFMIEAQNDWC